MTHTFPAFEVGPVPAPGTDATPPEPFRGIYAMPMFTTLPAPDLALSADFWIRGLGFLDLFSVPGQITHLRRWTFQDVLLVPGERPDRTPPVSVSFACVLNQIEEIAAVCEELRPGCTAGPRRTPWNTVDLEVTTPENARVVMTAARPHTPGSAEAEHLRSIGITPPGE
ncbi:glycosyl transferase [Nocardiopsis sp. CNT312]|uniref:glycosyl transferase n=1 Tax=Nocardiopsis sp. CNT312 TaxID=1137268 RepID=UPI00048F624E|nr:glycosyl transferase [Nocardiopsis sp. CNT312]